MFDTDGNQEIDLEEFKVLEDIFSQSATNALKKVFVLPSLPNKF